MSEFKVGDLVKIVKTDEEDLGVVDRISAIDEDGLICVGDEDLPYPLGCWHTADELAPQEPAPVSAAGDRTPGEIAADLYGGRFNEGWIAASRSMLDILERTLDNAPAGYRLAAIEKLIEDMRVDYPKAANALAADGEGDAGDAPNSMASSAVYHELKAENARLQLWVQGQRKELDALDTVRVQLGNMLYNLKQQPDMKRVTDSLASIMDSAGWDKS
jgi:hypothetical protein